MPLILFQRAPAASLPAGIVDHIVAMAAYPLTAWLPPPSDGVAAAGGAQGGSFGGGGGGDGGASGSRGPSAVREAEALGLLGGGAARHAATPMGM